MEPVQLRLISRREAIKFMCNSGLALSAASAGAYLDLLQDGAEDTDMNVGPIVGAGVAAVAGAIGTGYFMATAAQIGVTAALMNPVGLGGLALAGAAGALGFWLASRESGSSSGPSDHYFEDLGLNSGTDNESSNIIRVQFSGKLPSQRVIDAISSKKQMRVRLYEPTQPTKRQLKRLERLGKGPESLGRLRSNKLISDNVQTVSIR